MNGLQNDWYVAGPDGEAIGPLARMELARRHAAGQFGRDALAWHVEHAEWLPLSRVAIGLSSLTVGAAPPPASSRGPDAPPKPSRKSESGSERRPPPPTKPAPGDERAAREARQLRELRERLAAGTAAAGATVAAARASGAKAAGEAKADAAQAAQRLQQGLRRLLARAIDVLWVGVPLTALGWAILGAAGDMQTVAPLPEALLLWSALFVLVPLEAMMLAVGGRTPGKALLGLRVAGPRGNPSFGAAWARSTTVLWRGVGLGILPLTLIACIVGGVQLLNNGEAPWDRAQGLSMRGEPLDNRGWQTALVALLFGLVAIAFGWWSQLAAELLVAAGAR